MQQKNKVTFTSFTKGKCSECSKSLEKHSDRQWDNCCEKQDKRLPKCNHPKKSQSKHFADDGVAILFCDSCTRILNYDNSKKKIV
jgi:hypothetical protein